MSEDIFSSSDSVRSGAKLEHVRTVTFDEPLHLQVGRQLDQVTVAYETYGQLNADGSNAVLICHALSGDSHVARHDEDDGPGWWDIAVGPGKAIDTEEYFVICPNVLGGCRGTTGPNSIDPATGRRYGQEFPRVCVADMVEVQRRLIDHLGIDQLLAVVGASMGGQQVLQWGSKLSHRTRGVIPIATSPRLTSQAMAFDVVARNAIMSDPAFRDGQYYDGGPTPDTGLAIARMLGHITYLSPESMRQKFGQDRNSPREIETIFEKDFSVGTYLAYQGEKFVERFDANSYVTLSRSMDLFDLGDDPRRLADTLRHSRCRWLVVSFTSDWLFPAWQSEQIVTALIASDKPVSYCNIASDCGHDAFLLPDEVDRYGRLVRHFLAHLSGNGKAAAAAADTPVREDPLSIFHTGRLDHDRVLKLIPPQASVLDLGCGDGTLLAALKRASHFPVVGVELDERAVISCVAKGVDCIHDDLNKGLKRFSDRQFDVVVLSWTLQAVLDVEGLLEDMLRVGRQCIVTFPNFGYHKLRTMLAERGRAPEGDRVFPHKWYNTPNLRFFTVLDFEELCSEKGVHIHKRLGLDLQRGCEVTDDVNRNADMAIFVISR